MTSTAARPDDPATGVVGLPKPRGHSTHVAELLARLAARNNGASLTHVVQLPERDGKTAPWPDWTPPLLRERLAATGIAAPWRHQVVAANRAWAGEHTVVATGTASGKSLAYQLPVLSALLADPRATALYLAPTKALAADQRRSLTALDLPDIRAAGYDGDTSREERAWVRHHSRLVLTNPDMLHFGILPGHRGWATFLRRLRFVVIDECHAYRGVFGSHVAHVLRRLRRLAAPDVTVLLASATSGDPAGSARQLTGLPVHAVTDDTSPRGPVVFGMWEPPLLPSIVDSTDDGDLPGVPQRRRSAIRETADLLTDAVSGGVRTMAFVRSRRGAEVVAATAARELDEVAAGLGSRVAAYRSGYLPEERRQLERQLRDGTLLGIATTNALELGVDVTGLDAVIMCGYPGTRASLWQQAGRAGRRQQAALALLVARDDPLDSYLVHHPEALFDRPVEATVLDPTNPYVLGPQLCAAAAERALTDADLDVFGGEPARIAAEGLVRSGALRRRPTGLYWTHPGQPDIDLRGTGGLPVSVVESATGRLLGTVDAASAPYLIHPGALHLHQGVSYLVDDLDLVDGLALVRAANPDWTTHAREVTSLSVSSVRSLRDAGPVGLFFGEVEVTHQVVSYQRRRMGSGEVIDTRPLEMPVQQLSTAAVWFTISARTLAEAGLRAADVPGALHAAEHAAIGLLPLIATCDRWDIGGLSTADHADTEAPTVFVYDGQPGGAGFAERAYDTAVAWLTATRQAIAECRCSDGCPSCVYSPKCGNGNSPLHKAGAVKVLDIVLRELTEAS